MLFSESKDRDITLKCLDGTERTINYGLIKCHPHSKLKAFVDSELKSINKPK